MPPVYEAAFDDQYDADLDATADVPMTGSGSQPTDPSLAQVMVLLTQLIQSMPANIAAAVKKDERPQSQLDNVKLGVIA